DLRADRLEPALAVAPAAIQQFVDRRLGLLGLHLPLLHEISDGSLRSRLRHGRKSHAGVEQTAQKVVLGHGCGDYDRGHALATRHRPEWLRFGAMLPLRDDNPTQHRPIVTLLIIGLCVVAYFFWQPTPFEDTRDDTIFTAG